MHPELSRARPSKHIRGPRRIASVTFRQTLLPVLLLALGAVPARATQPFLEHHCIECHDADTAKGGVRLDNLPADFANPDVANHWIDVFDQVSAGTMPPKKKDRPPEADRTAFLTDLRGKLTAAQLAHRNADGRVVLRRLNRTEYENTVHDLLGVEVPLSDLLPEDSASMGFDNVAAALSVSSVLMERYLETADTALDAAIQTGRQPGPRAWRLVYGPDVRGNDNDFRLKRGVRFETDGSTSIFNSGDLLCQLDRFRAPVEGHYRFTFPVQAVHADDKPLVISVMAGSFAQGNPRKWTVGYFDVPADHPRQMVIDQFIPRGGTIKVMAHRLARVPLDDNEKRAGYQGPGLSVGMVEVEGPLNDSWPSVGHRRLFGDLNFATATVDDAKIVLQRFAPRAFRRPVPADELAPYVALVKGQLDQGKTFEDSIRVGLKAVLCSPEFLFLKERPGKLDPYAIASRLSYFLWSTTPDDELTKLAANGTLTQPAVLHAQVERLLTDKRSAEFTDNFCGQWLMLRQIDATSPDKRLYPDFDDMLQWSMLEESKAFFNELLTKDLSLLNFVDSKFITINSRLAEEYGIPNVTGIDVRRVDVTPESHRGGILGQAAVLKVTANGTNTSPVVRGAWVMRNLVGRPPKPPPPNVPAIEPDVRGAKTLREQLEKHRSVGTCAGCHAKIDPAGNALENFDVIGNFRTNYRSMAGKEQQKIETSDGRKFNVRVGPKVDCDDTWITGDTFDSLESFKQLLLKDKDQIARCLTEKLMVYATGAGLDFIDRPSVDAVVAHTRAKNYGFRTLVHEVVASEVFLNK